MLEKSDYRDNLERIKQMYPNKELITIAEVMAFLGVSRKVVKRVIGMDKYISVASLARKLCA